MAAKAAAQVQAAEFTGFSPALLKFFKGIAQNNNKEWYDAHKDEFLRDVIEPAKAFVQTAGQGLRRFSPGVGFDPDHNGRGSIKKIQTDRRFNPDRDPYKAWLEMIFWEGPFPVRKENSGFYLRVAPGGVILAGGSAYFEKAALKAFRESVAHPQHGPALDKAVKAVLKSGPYKLGGEELKSAPRGSDPAHPYAQYLRHTAMFAFLEAPLPAELHSPAFADWCLAHWKNFVPLHKWMLELQQRV